MDTAQKIADAVHRAAEHFSANELDQAEEIATQVLSKDPGQADALQIMGHIRNRAQRNDEAAAFFQKSLKNHPNQPTVWVSLGDALNLVRRTDEAEHAFKMALEYDPSNLDAWLWLGMGALGRNDPAYAITCFLKCVEIDPLKGAAYNLLAKIKDFVPDKKFMTALEGLAVESAATKIDRAYAHYALAAFSRRNKNKDDFVKHVEAANKIQNAMAPMFDPAGEALEKQSRTEFKKETLKNQADSGFMKTTPIFIVGLPRSGSTLVEQILSRHKKVFTGDELLFMYSHLIPALEKKTGLPCPEGASKLKPIDWEKIGKSYHDRIAALSNGAPFVTDKMLTNVNYIGLIRLALPDAKIIYIRRNLMDIALSIYSNYFEERMAYCCNLKKLGDYVRRLQGSLEQWRTMSPGFIHETSYEDLVQNQEHETRKILEFCGLEWDPACLDFYKSDRQVYTHSITQVFEPMYTSSIGKWKDYAGMLAPFQSSIRDLIDEDGFLKG